MTDKIINITEGSIPRQVIRLAWPAVSAMFFRTALTIVNAVWVGRLGSNEMAAVISSMFVIWILFSLYDIVWTGAVAVVSRFYGARQFDTVSHAARQAIITGVAAAIPISILGCIFAGDMFAIMHTDKIVSDLGTSYLQILFGASVLMMLPELFASIFRATGDTKTPLMISTVVTFTNIILDPLLIFGIGPFPQIGVPGAALATVFSWVVGLSLFIVLIRGGRLTFKFNFSRFVRPDGRMIGELIKIGSPLAAAGVTFSVVYLFMNRITASFGTEAIAALGIGNRCESISYLTCFGFSLAVSTLVGQNLGAGKPERAAKSVWYALLFTGISTGVISLAFLMIPHVIASGFINDPKVIVIASDYLMILALSQTFMAIEIVMEGAFTGAGNTLPAMIVSLVGSFARFPLALYICHDLGVGVNGVWWSITLTTIVKGIALLIWFSRGKWKSKQIRVSASTDALQQG
ncbi:MAG: MATE family efflux transporter [bacterium]|nr:MATE family efflux transporter [bacterium]